MALDKYRTKKYVLIKGQGQWNCTMTLLNRRKQLKIILFVLLASEQNRFLPLIFLKSYAYLYSKKLNRYLMDICE